MRMGIEDGARIEDFVNKRKNTPLSFSPVIRGNRFVGSS